MRQPTFIHFFEIKLEEEEETIILNCCILINTIEIITNLSILSAKNGRMLALTCPSASPVRFT